MIAVTLVIMRIAILVEGFLRRLWRFSRDGGAEKPDGPEREKSCFVFHSSFSSVFNACIQELWDIARRAGTCRRRKAKTWGLASWRLGGSATWRRTMFAAGERPFFLSETSSDTSLIFSGRSVPTLLVIRSLVPPSPVTLSLPAERSAQPPRLLTDG